MSYRLPLNRREVYFTAAVLTGLLSANEFANLRVLVSLLSDAHALVFGPGPVANQIEFYPEYDLVKSVQPPSVRAAYGGAPRQGPVPDLVVAVPGPPAGLVAIEGKMFDTTSSSELIVQMNEQRPIVTYLASLVGAQAGRVFHEALLPRKLHQELAADLPETLHVIDWEDLLVGIQHAQPDNLFLAPLEWALHDFDQLRGPRSWGPYDYRKGCTIYESFHADPTGSLWRSIGTRGGGETFLQDVSGRRWQVKKYAVSAESDLTLLSSRAPEQSNWTSVATWVNIVDKHRFRDANRDAAFLALNVPVAQPDLPALKRVFDAGWDAAARS